MNTEPPEIETLIQLRDEYNEEFNNVISQTEPFGTGMWFSELFIYLILCEYFECNRIIESGRDRGVSTEIISRYFEGTGTTVTSIDNSNPKSKDAEIAEDRLSDLDNVNLLYGNSREILPDLVTESDQKQTAVLIDGPKNDAALKLAIDLLENTGVQIIGVHDLDKDRLHRDLSELLFNNQIYTDEEALVEAFKQYDSKIHDWCEDNRAGILGPYMRHGEKKRSYAPTLGIFFNSDAPVDQRVKNNYIQYQTSEKDTIQLVGEILDLHRNNGSPLKRNIAELLYKSGSAIVSRSKEQ